ncbi:hypothetical protein B0A49_01954 [Cryomyces minteri]|uniref:Uncharacterized protein n=1 Tax=Cryomyces minteri TaxID=331657 RepID=A0A4U0XX64_9PEZI|nr:hypothetical protein B0A49_03907 [Cryomyces minteri]TKA80190.1 hypothetical protein B0A49_01904 [Cryomyces minteri]TKA80203.1 hypothetical protein B0A49_01954 [Cryomyces minteri]
MPFANSVPQRLQLASSILSLLVAAAILGCAAHSLAIFRNQRSVDPWWLYLWPQHFDTRGTEGLLGTAAAIVVLKLLYLGVPRVSAVSSRSAHRQPIYDIPPLLVHSSPSRPFLLVVATTLPALLIGISAIAFAATLNNAGPLERDTIQTWTCRWSGRTFGVGNAMAARGAPKDFRRLCVESQFALFAMLPVLVLQLLSLGIAGWNFRTSRSGPRPPTTGDMDEELRPVSYDSAAGRSEVEGKEHVQLHVVVVD